MSRLFKIILTVVLFFLAMASFNSAQSSDGNDRIALGDVSDFVLNVNGKAVEGDEGIVGLSESAFQIVKPYNQASGLCWGSKFRV